MANPSDSEDMILIEVQTGTYFGEDDIVRIEDDYKKRMRSNKRTMGIILGRWNLLDNTTYVTIYL